MKKFVRVVLFPVIMKVAIMKFAVIVLFTVKIVIFYYVKNVGIVARIVRTNFAPLVQKPRYKIIVIFAANLFVFLVPNFFGNVKNVGKVLVKIVTEIVTNAKMFSVKNVM